MLDDLFLHSQQFLRNNNRPYKRYFLQLNNFESRLSLLIGQRGIGKTTTIIQYILESYEKDFFTEKALYIQADHFQIKKYSLFEIAESFSKYGGELLCIDEIHKYPDWSIELKSIFDSFPSLKIIASGSSLLQITKGTHDLSRRAIVYKLFGMSFREFIELTLGVSLPQTTLENLLKHHRAIADKIIRIVESKGEKILSLYRKYLQYGYYPYFLEYKEKSLFYQTLEQQVHTTLESDLLTVFPSLTGISIYKILRLLAIISDSVPFTPDLSKLKQALDIGDERTLKTYLAYLEDAGIVSLLRKKTGSMRQLSKPEKIYLNNCPLLYSLSESTNPNVGTQREIFFISSVAPMHKLYSTERGDFVTGDNTIFEVGGKGKDFSQIRGEAKSYLAIDNIEIGTGNKIPLYLFGFLY